MSAYLIVTIALLPVAPIIKVVLTKFGVGTKNDEELGVALTAGSVAIVTRRGGSRPTWRSCRSCCARPDTEASQGGDQILRLGLCAQAEGRAVRR
jgi:hypothetical protein